MDLYAILDQVVALLRQRQRVTYRALQVHFQLADETLAALVDELQYAHPEVHDDAGRGLVWTGGLDTPPWIGSTNGIFALPSRRHASAAATRNAAQRGNIRPRQAAQDRGGGSRRGFRVRAPRNG